MRLNGKVAIVTGAGSGNGAAIAVEYLRQGARVVFADINEESARAVAGQSGYPDTQWLVQKVDVSNRDSVKACVDAAVSRFGRLDIMVANAGITVRKHFLEMTTEELDRVMDVNCKGVFLCCQEAARVMADQGEGGALILMSSIASIIAPQANIVGYGASKGAVLSMTRHMALDLKDYNIRVNAIAPGTILTGLNRERLSRPEVLEWQQKNIMMGRIGSPQELAGAAVFLASDESSFMTGTQIVIDGGETAQ
jgi:NAD(P)-dependent dehydrogenase (short-subunit alcohol dehydrogenase family)